MGRKKKFIDKKSSHTFQLLARDSTDPAFSQSDRIFVRVDNNPLPDDSIFEDAPEDPDAEFNDSGAGGLPEDVRKEILELGFPDDGYNYLEHMREIKNAGGGSFYFNNPKFKLQHLPRDVKAYDASRLQIKEADEEPEENTIYTVASNTSNVRVQKVVDPEVAALLDYDSDVSRFASDVEDLEEDFVVRANLHEDKGEDKALVSDGMNLAEESTMNRRENNAPALQVSSHSADNCGPLNGVSNGVTGVHFASEKPRPRRLLDDQFDLLERQEYGTDDDHSDDDDYDGDYYEKYQDEDESLAEKLKLSLGNRVIDNVDLDNGEKYKVPADFLKKKGDLESEEQEDSPAAVIRRCKEYAEQYEVEDDGEDVVILEESSDESEVYDCETIISTYSNLDNHPGKIEAPGTTRKKKLTETMSAAFSSSNPIISLKGKAKLPVEFLPGGRKPASEKVKDTSTAGTELYKRKQHGLESKEEKKERKAAVKEERREARRAKKEMKELYKGEAHRAQRTAAVSGPSTIHLM